VRGPYTLTLFPGAPACCSPVPRGGRGHADCLRAARGPRQLAKAAAAVAEFKAAVARVEQACRAVAETALLSVERKRVYGVAEFAEAQAQHRALVRPAPRPGPRVEPARPPANLCRAGLGARCAMLYYAVPLPHARRLRLDARMGPCRAPCAADQGPRRGRCRRAWSMRTRASATRSRASTPSSLPTLMRCSASGRASLPRCALERRASVRKAARVGACSVRSSTAALGEITVDRTEARPQAGAGGRRRVAGRRGAYRAHCFDAN